MNAFSRTELLLGRRAMERLAECRVAVFGIGGVGGHAAEALARSGIGALDLIDNDTVSLTNLNRQLFATRSTLGMYKTEAARNRLLDINPDLVIREYRTFYLPENADQFDVTAWDYVIDAVDTVQAKLELAVRCHEAGTRIISSMGAGNKLDPTRFEVADIYETSICPLARVMRQNLRKRNVSHLKVVYSREEPRTPYPSEEELPAGRRQIPGSTAFVPSVAGLILAREVICDLVADVMEKSI